MKNAETSKDNAGVVHKKRILLVVRWPVGGIRTFMRYVFRNFEPGHYHFSILGPDIPELDVLAIDLDGLDFEIIKISESPSSYELLRAAARLLKCGKYDLVHSQGFTSGICTALPAFIFRTPHILTSHDVLSSAQFTGITGRMKKLVMGIALSLVNTIHSVSHDAQGNLLEFFPQLGNKKGKCIVILNGIETERFVNAAPRDLHGELGLGEDVFLIGFLGRFMAQKGFVYLMDAINHLKQSENMSKKPLVLAFGEGGFVREEKEELAKRGLEEYFLFLPFTANVAGVIKGLNLVAMPSLWEACPLLPMEVLVCGVPLLASNCIGLREVVKNTPTYVVASRDSKALAEGIKHFMENDLRKPFADFVAKAEEEFNVKKMALNIKEQYHISF